PQSKPRTKFGVPIHRTPTTAATPMARYIRVLLIQKRLKHSASSPSWTNSSALAPLRPLAGFVKVIDIDPACQRQPKKSWRLRCRGYAEDDAAQIATHAQLFCAFLAGLGEDLHNTIGNDPVSPLFGLKRLCRRHRPLRLGVRKTKAKTPPSNLRSK